MALLTTDEYDRLERKLNTISRNQAVPGYTLQGELLRADLRQLLELADVHQDTVAAASFNTSIPLPLRSTATAETKTVVYALVALARVGLI